MWPRKSRKTEPLAVTFFTRKSCPLCDEGWLQLEQAIQASGRHATVERIDIDARPELVELYGTKVPVVAVAGKERCWGRFSTALLLRTLQNA